MTYLRVHEEIDPATPDAYYERRARSGDAVVNEIVAAGGRAVATEADLRDPATVTALFDQAEAELGPVDILVNNASDWLADTFGVAHRDRIGRRNQRVTADTFDRQFMVDARAAALMIGEFAERHAARSAEWGRIVGLTSGGPNGFPEEVSYGAAKAALESYTMSAAFELADLGVTANIVHPPVTDTGWITDAVRLSVRRSNELLHVAQPEEVAQTIAYICSDAARLITANVIRLR